MTSKDCIYREWDGNSIKVNPACPSSEHGPVNVMRAMADALALMSPYSSVDI